MINKHTKGKHCSVCYSDNIYVNSYFKDRKEPIYEISYICNKCKTVSEKVITKEQLRDINIDKIIC